jgi:hypothetical protein
MPVCDASQQRRGPVSPHSSVHRKGKTFESLAVSLLSPASLMCVKQAEPESRGSGRSLEREEASPDFSCGAQTWEW